MPGSLGYRGCWAPPRPAQAAAAPLRLFGSRCPSLAGGRCPAATGRVRAAGPGGRGRWRHRIPSVPPARPSRPGTASYRCCLPLPSAPGGTGPGTGTGTGTGSGRGRAGRGRGTGAAQRVLRWRRRRPPRRPRRSWRPPYRRSTPSSSPRWARRGGTGGVPAGG